MNYFIFLSQGSLRCFCYVVKRVTQFSFGLHVLPVYTICFRCNFWSWILHLKCWRWWICRVSKQLAEFLMIISSLLTECPLRRIYWGDQWRPATWKQEETTRLFTFSQDQGTRALHFHGILHSKHFADGLWKRFHNCALDCDFNCSGNLASLFKWHLINIFTICIHVSQLIILSYITNLSTYEMNIAWSMYYFHH